MNKEKVYLKWLEFAKEDLESAKFLTNKYPKPLEIICYHCQQSAEKYLKAYLIFKETQPRKTHDLDLLNNNCQQFDVEFEKILDECQELTDYGVVVRYPEEIGINEMRTNRAIELAEEVQKFVISKFKEC